MNKIRTKIKKLRATPINIENKLIETKYRK